jgi:hypothetical protein
MSDVSPIKQAVAKFPYFGAGLLSSVNLRLLRYARNDAMNHVIARVVAVGIAGETRSNPAIL